MLNVSLGQFATHTLFFTLINYLSDIFSSVSPKSILGGTGGGPALQWKHSVIPMASTVLYVN
jgi:hypothetical protein